MMTTRKKSSRTAVQSTTTERTLTAQEEKVVRMRYGATVPAEMPLGRVGQEHAETRTLLEAMERRAFAAVAAQAGQAPNPTKRKIVSALRGKN